MALKITTKIGTDKGITSEAYVRISEYQVSKYGSITAKIELYQSDPGKLESIHPIVDAPVSKNHQIGDSILIKLIKEIETEDGNIKVIPDISILDNTTIFEFTYSKLKEKLSDIFGEKYVIDC